MNHELEKIKQASKLEQGDTRKKWQLTDKIQTALTLAITQPSQFSSACGSGLDHIPGTSMLAGLPESRTSGSQYGVGGEEKDRSTRSRD